MIEQAWYHVGNKFIEIPKNPPLYYFGFKEIYEYDEFSGSIAGKVWSYIDTNCDFIKPGNTIKSFCQYCLGDTWTQETGQNPDGSIYPYQEQYNDCAATGEQIYFIHSVKLVQLRNLFMEELLDAGIDQFQLGDKYSWLCISNNWEQSQYGGKKNGRSHKRTKSEEFSSRISCRTFSNVTKQRY